MMNDYNRVFLLIFLTLLLFVFSGCQRIAENVVTPSPIVISKATSTLASLPLATPSPSATSTAKASITPTVTMTVTETPTQPPLSTLLPTEAAVQVQDLMKTNGGCQLPCWMGITPGKTRWDQAKAYLLPFADLYYDTKRTTLLYVDVLFKKPKGQDPVSLVGQMTVEDDIVTYVMANFSHEDFPFWEFLSEHQRPEEIRISANGNYTGLGDSGDFVIVLFYPQNGIMAAFRGTSNQGKILHICPALKNFQPEYHLLLWDPSQFLSFERAGQLIDLPVRNNSDIVKDYVLLQDVTNLDVETFAKTYQQKSNLGKCFDAPALGEK